MGHQIGGGNKVSEGVRFGYRYVGNGRHFVGYKYCDLNSVAKTIRKEVKGKGTGIDR